MGIPGFVADATLYASTVSYRGTLSKYGGSVHDVISEFPSFARPCDTIGQRCCPPDFQVNTPHCHKSLGCNITTGLCEQCGGPGQVCCDGDFTGFSRKNYTGVLLDPTERIQSCNEGARCDAQLAPDGASWLGTRRCGACGNKRDAPCCAPDTSFGLGRCFTDQATGRRLTCGDPFADASTCVVCGGLNEPSCGTRPICDTGLVELNGKCVPCGHAGQPSCDLTGCDKETTIYDWKHDICLAAGGPGQPCRQNGTCINPGTFCDANKMCSECGWGWSRGYPMLCCPAGSPGPPCLEGRCQKAGQEFRCLCGWENQVPCLDGCKGGYVERNGLCRKGASPPPPPPPPQWKTCNGEDSGILTMDHTVFIRHPNNNNCIIDAIYKANSAQEAFTCARRDFGDRVVTDSVESYKFAVRSAFGCTGVTLLGTDEDEAQACAQSGCVNCTVTPGDCF